MALTRPIADLPLILCGPMLRRTEVGSVSVFLALKHARSVTLKVKTGSQEKLVGTASTIALGRYMHVAVVTADQGAGLTHGQLYNYDVKLDQLPSPAPDDPGPASSNLEQNDLLSGTHPLGYQPGQLPGFIMSPQDAGELRIAHASCRKAHGGERDMLSVLDRLIAKSSDDPLLRPHVLFLTGDQIYSDDVSPHLLRAIYETGHRLLMWGETLPLVGAQFGSPWDISPMRSYLRGDVVHNIGGYTSGHRDAHLAFLGEYLTMYLMAWSDVLWPRESSAPNIPTLPSTAEAIKFDDLPGATTLKKIKAMKKAEEIREGALVYAATLPSVRRALANIPTYMMFDDHEISDDWFLTWNWTKAVRGNQLGRQLLRNGMLAYAVCQDWGNQPADYVAGFGRNILDGLICTFPSPGTVVPPPIDQSPSMLNGALDIEAIHSGVDERTFAHPAPVSRKRWDYEIAEPQRRFIVMDTRTWRIYRRDTLNGKGAVGLLSDEAIQFQISDRLPPIADEYTILISPAPVIGYQFMEETVQPIGRTIMGPEFADYEAWSIHKVQFEKFLAALANFGRVIMLSGDVHYGFSNSTAYFRDDTPAAPPARFVQLCSSSLKNEDGLTRLLSVRGHPSDDVGWLGFGHDIHTTMKKKVADVLKNKEWFKDVSALKFWLYRSRTYFDIASKTGFKNPAVLPAQGWHHDVVFTAMQALAQNTDWRYRTTYARDDRSDLDLGSDVMLLNPGAVDGEIVLSQREVVGTNNLGLVAFTEWGTHAKVVHRLAWYGRTPNQEPIDAVFFTEHKLLFEPPTASERPEVGR